MGGQMRQSHLGPDQGQVDEIVKEISARVPLCSLDLLVPRSG